MKKRIQKTKVYHSIFRNIIVTMMLVFTISMAVVGLSYAQDILLMELITLSLFFSLLAGLTVGAFTAIFTFFVSEHMVAGNIYSSSKNGTWSNVR